MAVSVTVVPTSDLVGFGKHADSSYQDLWDKEPGYCIWTINKFQELVKLGDEFDSEFNTGESKMKRLAQWLKQTEDRLTTQGPEMEYNDDMELVPKPGQKTLAERAAKIQSDNQEKFYAVAYPDARVYTSWEECKPRVVGVKGVMYKSFPTREEAEEYIRNPPARRLSVRKRPKGDDETPPVGSGSKEAASAEGEETKEPKKKKAKALIGDEDNRNEQSGEAVEKPKKLRKVAQKKNKDGNAAEGAASPKTDIAKKEALKSPMKGKAKFLAKQKAKAKGKARAKIEQGKASKSKKPETNGSTDALAAREQAPKKAKVAMLKTCPMGHAFTLNPEDDGWACNGRESALGCAGGCTDFDQTSGWTRYTCEICDYDLCKECCIRDAPEPSPAKSSAPKAKPKKTGKTEKAPMASKVEKAEKVPTAELSNATQNKKATTEGPGISAEVMAKAQDAGMVSSLQNLIGRMEIRDLGLHAEQVLDALMKADGLVNKAKNALLGGSTSDPATPPSKSSSSTEPTLETSKVTPAKTEPQKSSGIMSQFLADFDKSLEDPDVVPETKLASSSNQLTGDRIADLTELQRLRIEENRVKALARRAQKAH